MEATDSGDPLARGLLPSPSTDGMSSCRSLSGASFRSRAATLTDSSCFGASEASSKASIDGPTVAVAADAVPLGLQVDSRALKGDGVGSVRSGAIVLEDAAAAAASREGLFPAATVAASSSGRTAVESGSSLVGSGRKSGTNEDVIRVPGSSLSRLDRHGAGGSPLPKPFPSAAHAAAAAAAAAGGDSHYAELGGRAEEARGSDSRVAKYHGVGGGRTATTSGERPFCLLHAPPAGMPGGGGCGGNIARVGPRYHSSVPMSEHRLRSAAVEVKWRGQEVRGFVPTASIQRTRKIGKP